jgi:hypothetical protein
MASPTLEVAASRLAERLRAAPSDAIVERLQERTARVRELREQGAADWTACKTAIEALIDDAAAKRQRVTQACAELVDGLQALVPSIGTMAEEAAIACADAAAAVEAPMPPLAALKDRLEAEVERWAAETGGFIVGLVEGRAQTLAQAQQALAREIGTNLRADLTRLRGLLETWTANASEVGGAATSVLNAAYEEWGVRIAQVADLAGRDGKDRVSAHAQTAATAAVSDGAAAQGTLVARVRSGLQSASGSLAALEWSMQSVSSEVEEALGAAFAAIDGVGQAAAAASQELQDSTVRLHVFASGMLA